MPVHGELFFLSGPDDYVHGAVFHETDGDSGLNAEFTFDGGLGSDGECAGFGIFTKHGAVDRNVIGGKFRDCAGKERVTGFRRRRRILSFGWHRGG